LLRVPSLFVSSQGPELASDSVTGAELAAWAKALPRPRGILVVSATWTEPMLTRGTTSRRPELYDGGVYTASGDPELAYEVASRFPPRALAASPRGWDHGVWAPLRHMVPEGDVPVLQLSLVTGATPRRLFAIGRALGDLPSCGYLILGVGAITDHPTERSVDRNAPIASWAQAFDGWVANLLADAEVDQLFAWRKRAPNAARARSVGSRLDPLFVVAGVASAAEHAVGFPIRGFSHATFSRRCVQFGR
jgi:4,5-DOPA dioxygenase extradiol